MGTQKSVQVVKVVLVGIGGYGDFYVNEIEKLRAAGQVELCGVVDPMAVQAPGWPKLAAAGVPQFDSLEAFIATQEAADFAVISSPIAFHAEQACTALAAGMHVLCEKPLTATVAEALRMQAASVESGKFLEIGYQWSFSKAIQQLKTDILAGRFGAPRQLLTRVAWPRTSKYYGRNNWAGKIKDSQGREVFDSPINNATAHYLHNMLYVLGAEMDRSATPATITAECYRANPIDNFDAACLRVDTVEGAEILFFSAHCVLDTDGPVFRYVFDDAVVNYSGENIVAEFANGEEQSYGDPNDDAMSKLKHCVARCRKEGDLISICGVEAAMAQTRCVQGLQSMNVTVFTPGQIKQHTITSDEVLTYFPQMGEAITQGFDHGKLFSEMSLPWAANAASVSC